MAPNTTPVFEVKNLSVFYGMNQAVADISMSVRKGKVTALIGPSGCGKSTFLRCLNRMNDFVPDARVTGHVQFEGQDIYASSVDPAVLRRHVGMVFQKSNPFPSSIIKNLTWGPKLAGFKGNTDQLVEESLKKAALWDEVKDKLKASGLSLSGGQQQRLCIARVLAMDPKVILMDEPCSALDPISTRKIEELIASLSSDYSIVIVTHNMQQARRISHDTAFFFQGKLIEYGATEKIFSQPENSMTSDYVSGRFG